MVYSAVRIPAKKVQTASLIFLHGLGDTGHGWSFIAEEATGARSSHLLDHVKFIFPHAPEQPVSINMGMSMPSWYDIKSLTAITDKQDEAGVLKSVNRLKEVIAEEIALGIPTDRIVIGGFSQGCAVALAASVALETKFAGVVGLSGYLPVKEKLVELGHGPVNAGTPYFMGHGTADSVVQFKYGQMSRDYLKSALKREYVDWKEYKDMEHSLCPEELVDLLAFTAKVLPAK